MNCLKYLILVDSTQIAEARAKMGKMGKMGTARVCLHLNMIEIATDFIACMNLCWQRELVDIFARMCCCRRRRYFSCRVAVQLCVAM